MRFVIVSVLALAACPGYPPAGPPPGALQPPAIEAARLKDPAATAESLEAGRQSFLQSCNTCHKFPALGAYSDAQWEKIVPRMAGKAALSLTSGDQILQFILAARASSTSPASKP